MMRAATKLELIAAAVVVILGLLGLHFYEQKEKALAVADATQKAQETVQKQLVQMQADMETKIKARDDAANAQLAEMARTVAQLKTPTQIVGWSQQQLQDAIKGIQITVPAPTPENPHPQAQVTIPEASLPGLRDTIEKCQECSLKLGVSQAEVADRKAQQEMAQQQIESLKKERDAAMVSAKGGSWLRRTGRAILIASCAAGGGYAASPHGSKAAGIGAAAGAVICTIATH